MTPIRLLLATTLVAAAMAQSPVLAQDAAFALPEACTANLGHDAMHGNQGGMMGMMNLDGMPDHVRRNMDRMGMTMPAMQMGMMNADADVAFACGMIAHHQGAIDMATVLLEHGDDPEMRALAEAIIAAQGPEIAQMTAWLEANAN